MIDLKRLTILQAVAHHGSVTGAARALSYSPSAVSQQLAALERELDVQLVYRAGRRVTMTPAGRELALRAAVMLELAHEFHSHARDTVAAPALSRVATFPGAVEWLIAPAVTRCAGAGIRAEVVVADPDAATRLVRHGLADIAVVYQAGDRAMPGLAAERLADAPLRIVCAASRGYPPPTIAAAANLPWILPVEGTIARTVTDAALTAAGASPRVAATASTLHAVAALVAAGAGVALLPDFAIAQFASAVLVREPRDVASSFGVWLLRSEIRTNAEIDVLADAVRRVASVGSVRTDGAGLLLHESCR